ncbi:PREDICTED: E3 ubiquitin-protein ligase RNF185-like [Wasmannia auropunctata]|uniref:E3 ubiquitin-protein ligase RNF185-like n=1 Tax=Wasmannia auropunctata TaxID=64793 RepID=UPI0005EF51EE|nr:PREDICTED: E3 ubiquitin-protein ligase RNF185-like [Wasmannia auropunctata]XP_011688606.1 PREDICTED: E3 ubiquitin-protein ligase RNF185-like [Wasmannia auropunctata]XP_011688607.1 PREDICTED: E3 ubiquitin-protein ligase RNF185-like [Wasmannia auropunctata]XP_011688608.1 PREDICTED: E3 ubiquitin-protein ligase RNF185-like [Wasmannia auropunctata]
MTEEQQPGPSSQCASYKNGVYKCIICDDEVKDAVSTQCGHVCCWPCLHQWLKKKQVCPICRNAVNPAQVIPTFIGGTAEHPTRYNVPPPTGQRSAEPEAWIVANCMHFVDACLLGALGVAGVAGVASVATIFGIGYMWGSKNQKKE